MTICTQNRERLFGDIADNTAQLNDAGVIVHDEWLKSAQIRNEITLDKFCVMPNHFHVILSIIDTVEAYGHTPLQQNKSFQSPSKTIGAMVRSFKAAVTKRINEIRAMPGISVWQRNYYDHVIRNDDDLNRIREYIENNPANWLQDELFA